MRHRIAIPAAALLFAAPLAAETNVVATDPVGYITVPIAGTGGTNSPAYTFLGLSMIRDFSYQGVLTSVGANSLTDTNANWAEDQFNGTNGSFTVEIASGNNEGVQTTILDTLASSDTLQTADDISPSAAVGDSYKIYKNWTIGSVFGVSNSAGLAGGNVSTADLLMIWNGVGTDKFYYKTSGVGGTGWRNATNIVQDASTAPLLLEQGIMIRRQAGTSTNITIVGAVKVTDSAILVEGTNYTFAANPYPVDMTLASSDLYTGNVSTGVKGGNVSTADLIQFWAGNKADTFYYKTSGVGGTGWRNATNVVQDASGKVIPGGSFFIVKRKDSLPFMWTPPVHPIPAP